MTTVDPYAERPAVSPARVLMLTLLGAAIWIALSVFGSTSPASAADNTDTGDSLLGVVTGSVNEFAPLPTIVEQVAEPPAATEDRIAPQVSAATVDAVETTVAIIEETTTVVEQAVQPILHQPLLATTFDRLSELAGGAAPLPSSTADTAAEPTPAPALVAQASLNPDLNATTGYGSLSDAVQPNPPTAPSAPVAPTSPDVTTPTPTSSGHPLEVAILGSGSIAPRGAATASAESDALPSSPTFDNDHSPD